MNQVSFNSNIVNPSKVVCVGRNYVEHISELGNEIPDELVVFVKPNSAITDELLACRGEQLHYEGELSFLVEAGSFAAVGFGLDLTKRNLQSVLKSRGLPWERAKAFDGSALFGSFVAVPKSLDALGLVLEINGKTAQSGSVQEMIRRPQEILKEIQTFMELCDGDIVMTGTPRGVGPLSVGDRLIGRVLCEGAILSSAEWQVH